MHQRIFEVEVLTRILTNVNVLRLMLLMVDICPCEA